MSLKRTLRDFSLPLEKDDTRNSSKSNCSISGNRKLDVVLSLQLNLENTAMSKFLEMKGIKRCTQKNPVHGSSLNLVQVNS